jgi:hypothetical protein
VKKYNERLRVMSTFTIQKEVERMIFQEYLWLQKRRGSRRKT